MLTNRNWSVVALLAVVSLVGAGASADWVDMGLTNGNFSTAGTLGSLGQGLTIPANSGTTDMDTLPASPTFGQPKLFQDWRMLGAAKSGSAYSTLDGEARLYRSGSSSEGKTETPLLVHDPLKKPDDSYWTIESKVYKLVFDSKCASYSYKAYASFYYGDTDTSNAATWKAGSYFNFPTPAVWYPTAEYNYRGVWPDPLPSPSSDWATVTLYWDNTGGTTSTPWGEGPKPANVEIVYTGTGNQRLGEHMRVGFVGAQNGGGAGQVTNMYIDNVSVSYFVDTPPPPVWHPGDANKDGVIDLQDFGLLKDNFGVPIGGGATWEMGDFNADGGVDLQDFGILKDHFGHSAGDPITAIPEPACLGLLAAALAGGIRRRPRR